MAAVVGAILYVQNTNLAQEKQADILSHKASRDYALKAQTWIERARKQVDAKNFGAANEMLMKGAALSSPEESIRIAGFYLRGDWGQRRDLETVLKIANSLPDPAKYRLYTDIGRVHAQDRNEAKTIEFLEPAADAGNIQAMIALADFYASFVGRYNPDAFNRATALYDRAIAKGNKWAAFAKARETLRQPSIDKSADGVELMLELISEPTFEADARLELAAYYEDARHKTPDYAKAFEQFSLIKNPTPTVRAKLSHYMLMGAGVTKNPEMARQMMEESAKDSYVAPDMVLGHLYRLGIGGPRDPQKALDAYKRFETAANNPAGHFIGAMYEAGDLPPPEGQTAQQAAIEFYKMGQAANNLTAYVMLARAYEAGKGVPQDLGKAFELMEHAAIGGSNMARRGMADYLTRGIGRDANPELAEIWRNKLREVNDPRVFNCALCDPKTD